MKGMRGFFGAAGIAAAILAGAFPAASAQEMPLPTAAPAPQPAPPPQPAPVPVPPAYPQPPPQPYSSPPPQFPGQSYPPQPGPAYPGQGYQQPAPQQYPGQSYPAQPGQTYPGQGYPQQVPQQYPGPSYPAQPGQTYPGQGYPGQPGQTVPSPGAGAGGPCTLKTSTDRSAIVLLDAGGQSRAHVPLGSDRVQKVFTSPDGVWGLAVYKVRGQEKFGALTVDLGACAPGEAVDLPEMPEDVAFSGIEATLRFPDGATRVLPLTRK